MTNQLQIKLNNFAGDVRQGLSATPKFLSSKYFYDDAGSDFFRQIMDLPEYYLTRTEAEIFSKQKNEIVKVLTAQDMPLDLLELGAGDGAKTAILIDCLLAEKVDFTYSPIDISAHALDTLTAKFKVQFPNLSIRSRCGDYFRILESLKSDSKWVKVIFFLGSNIGNFNAETSVSFLRRLRGGLGANDLLFIGFDLQKDPNTILRAYDDSQKVTAAFNLNLLERINRELGANFDQEKFSHYAEYSPVSGEAKSFLISRQNQTVFVKCLNEQFHFNENEPIFMEVSQKFSLTMIEELARQSGFNIVRNFFDGRKYFADSLWQTL